MGIEPTLSAWKAEVLPLNYTRKPRGNQLTLQNVANLSFCIGYFALSLVEGGGFEPPKAEPSDLQSDPFDRSGTPPKRKPLIVLEGAQPCQLNFHASPAFVLRLLRYRLLMEPAEGLEPPTL